MGRKRLAAAGSAHEGTPLTCYSNLPAYADQPRQRIDYDSDFITGYDTLMHEALRVAAGLGEPPTSTLDALQGLARRPRRLSIRRQRSGRTRAGPRRMDAVTPAGPSTARPSKGYTHD